MSLIVNGVSPSQINFVDETGQPHSPNVYVYSTTGNDLKEAKRTAVSSYTSTQLNGWVGKANDTWSGITNASELEANKYYYLCVYVTDTQKYGKFCVMFKSASGTTITVDNKGWGYDGEVIYSTPVWGKPFGQNYMLSRGSTGVQLPVMSISRVSSSNEHAGIGTLSQTATVYYGDILSIQASPLNTSYCVDTFTVGGKAYKSREVVSHTVSTTVIVTAKTTYYDNPQITCVVETTGIYYNKYTVTITNPNNVDGNVHYYIYGSGEYLLKEDTVDLGAKETLTITGSNTWYKSGMLVEATFQDNDNYYPSQFNNLSVNNYESSTGETTTT